ncbi:MAG: hypothetical protein OXS30_13075 [Chloroflexota bacterium]|nr:hypothetical protein [Chloroflexota bacterium]
MNLAQRSRCLQAHNLRCQGLTYRQIGQRMNCAASTAAGYVRRFEANRGEIIESLTADLLIHSVSALQPGASDQPDQPDQRDLHQQHIASARELRLLLNSLDQIEDRRQKRERRIHEHNVHDAEREIADLEEIARIMIETGRWDVSNGADDIEHLLEPIFGPNESRRRETQSASSPPNPAKPVQASTKSVQIPPKSEHSRTKSNKSEQKSAPKPPVKAPPRPKRKKLKRPPQHRQRPAQHSQRTMRETPVPAPKFAEDDIPNPPYDPDDMRYLSPDSPRFQRLFSHWGRR